MTEEKGRLMLVTSNNAGKEELDVAWIANCLVEKYGFSNERAQNCVSLYEKILDLIRKHPERNVAPPAGADKAMHVHILHTQKYVIDCKRLIGRYIHHDPEAFATKEYWEAWSFTREWFKSNYGIRLNSDEGGESDDLSPDYCLIMAGQLSSELGMDVASTTW